ncbi:MAG: NfeD family protein [Bdellovibrionales bacterium]
MELANEVWWWLILGGVLLASEMFTGTFYLLFFGFAAVATAVVANFESSLVLQISIFGILALLGVWYVRKSGFKSKSSGFESDLAQVITLSHDLKAGQEGTVQYQGAPWTAVNLSPEQLHRGERARIVKTEGVKIFLEKVQE